MTPKSSERMSAKPASASRRPSSASKDPGKGFPLSVVEEEKIPSGSRKKRKEIGAGGETPGKISRRVALDFGDCGPALPDVVGNGGVDSRCMDRGDATGIAYPDDGRPSAKSESVSSNLELVRLLQDSKALRSRKLEVAYEFVKHHEKMLDRSGDNGTQTQVQEAKADSLSVGQLVPFLSEWVQSAVLRSSKPQQVARIPRISEGKETQSEYPAHLDARYWAILRWCLSSGYLHSYSSVSPSLMKSINLYVTKILEAFDASVHDGDSEGRFQGAALLTEDSLGSVQALLTVNERSFRPDLDHWVSLASKALSRMVAFDEVINENEDVTSRLQRLMTWILEGFARFIAVHPNRRKAFTTVVENLLQSLLVAGAGLRLRSTQQATGVSNSESPLWSQRMLQAIEDVLEKGLFHAAHVRSFQQVCTVLAGSKEFDSKTSQVDKKSELDSKEGRKGRLIERDKDMHLSYHRLLFQKLEQLRQEGTGTALMELGWIFKTYSKSFKAHQTAAVIDVFGPTSKGKRFFESNADDTSCNNANGKESGDPVRGAHLGDEKSQKSEPFFIVFAEFIGPLMLSLESFSLSLSAPDFDSSIEHISSARSTLNAVGGLLKAAVEENTYVPTDFNANEFHMAFLEKCFGTLLKVGKSLPRAVTAGRAKAHDGFSGQPSGILQCHVNEHNLKDVLGDLLCELITAITCMMVMEYRVVENSLEDIWLILLAGLTVERSVGRPELVIETGKNTESKAVDAACQMIGIFSDLRQVERPLLALCTTLRGFMSQVSEVCHPEEEANGSRGDANLDTDEVSWFGVLKVESIELLACAKPLLLAVSSAVRAQPEGQVAEFLKLVRSDARESVALIDRFGNFNHTLESLTGYNECVPAGLRGLVELYSQMLESVSITSTNSVFCGKEVLSFWTEIVMPKFNQLVEFFVLDFSEGHVTGVGQTDKINGKIVMDALGNSNVTGSEKTKEDANTLNTWISVFILRLYMTTQSLHRESVSLMPPKAGKSASEAINGPAIDYQRGDASLNLSEVGIKFFLSGVTRGALKSSSLFAGIERRKGGQGLIACPALDYAMDCIALRSLVDLSGHIDALNFLLLRFEGVKDVAPNESGQQVDPIIKGSDAAQLESGPSLGFERGQKGVQKKLQKLLKTLRLESQKLTKFLLKGIHPLEERAQDTECKSGNLDSIDQKMNTRALRSKSKSTAENLQGMRPKWEWVGSLLTVDTLLVQRWKLLCSSFDVWAKHAVEEDSKMFLVCLFATLLICQKSHSAGDDHMTRKWPTTQEKQMKSVTDVLLGDALFYEEKSFRKVFVSTFLGELKRSLLSAFGRWPFESYTSDMLMTEEVNSSIAEEWAAFTVKVESDVGIEGPGIGTTILSSVGACEPLSITQTSAEIGKQLQDDLPFEGHPVKAGSLERLATKKQGLNSVKKKSPSKQRKNEGINWSKVRLTALEVCVGLLDHLSALPPGYIQLRECTPCAYTILCFERSMISCLLDLRAAARSGIRPAGLGELSTARKFLEAFGSCRAALSALSSSENVYPGNSPIWSVLAGSSASFHWLPFSIHTAAVCVVDSLECSTLPLQQKKDMMSITDCFLDQALKNTASLLTYVSDQNLRADFRRSELPEAEVKANVSEGLENSLQRSRDGMEQYQCPIFLRGLMDCYAKQMELVLGNNLASELQLAHHLVDGTIVGQIIKARYASLPILAALSSYTSCLSKFLEDSVKSSIVENRTSISLAGAPQNVRKLGQNIIGTLVNTVLPAGSHAILLVGECEVQRGTCSGGNGISIRMLSKAHRGSKQSKGMLNRGSDDEMIEDEENDLSIENESETEEDEKEDQKGLGEEGDAEGALESEALAGQEVADLGVEGDFGKYHMSMKVSETCTAQSSMQQALLEKYLEDSGNKFDVIGELYLATVGILKIEKMNLACSRTGGSSSALVEGSHLQDGLPADVNIVLGAGYWLLLKACEKTRPDQWSHLGWLVGVVKYVEAVYPLLPKVKPPLPPSCFTKLFGLHILLMGSLTSAQEYLYSSPFPLDDDRWGMPILRGPADERIHEEDQATSSLHSLHKAVQESVGTLLRTDSRQYSVLALQSIMRAMIGTAGEISHRSGLEICGVKSDKVDMRVAAGVECLRISLEAFSGMKRLRLLANHFNEFFGAIFNLLECLQGPHLFRKQELSASLRSKLEKKANYTQGDRTVESGPVMLQALQILITATSRDTVFPMKACHVALALHCPARVFSSLRHSWSPEYKTQQIYSPNEQMGKQRNSYAASALRISSGQGVQLYVLCCRLLCNLVRHRRRESGHCMALLGESVRVLLECLEAPNWPLSEEADPRSWSLRMAEYCASWLRRIYEEMGDHREAFGKYCSHMLSDYLTILSGHGPHAAGLMKAVEAALQPGAFALVDACSTNDLQQLHASLGEGSRRTALLDLRRQYQQRFKYTGKV